jgi:thiamine-phosphate pyrophosphorylase
MKNWDVYLVMDLQGTSTFSALEIAEQAIAGGATVIQIREKKMDRDTIIQMARPIRELCRQKGISFIVNDKVDLAVELDADGVHVGQEDMPGSMARKLIGTRILGISASSIEEAKRAIAEGADYLGVGSIYPTVSKADAGDAVTPALIEEIRAFCALPIVGIGGINQDNAGPVIEAGADSVAVISAICQAAEPKKATEAIREVVQQAKQRKS